MSADQTTELAHALRTLLAVYCGEEGKTPADCAEAERLALQTLEKWGHSLPYDCRKD